MLIKVCTNNRQGMQITKFFQDVQFFLYLELEDGASNFHL